jgi:hypothetical protein
MPNSTKRKHPRAVRKYKVRLLRGEKFGPLGFILVVGWGWSCVGEKRGRPLGREKDARCAFHGVIGSRTRGEQKTASVVKTILQSALPRVLDSRDTSVSCVNGSRIGSRRSATASWCGAFNARFNAVISRLDAIASRRRAIESRCRATASGRRAMTSRVAQSHLGAAQLSLGVAQCRRSATRTPLGVARTAFRVVRRPL